MFSVKTCRWWNHGTVLVVIMLASGILGWAVEARKISGESIGVLIGFLVIGALWKIENMGCDKRQLEAKVKELEAVVLSKLEK